MDGPDWHHWLFDNFTGLVAAVATLAATVSVTVCVGMFRQWRRDRGRLDRLEWQVERHTFEIDQANDWRKAHIVEYEEIAKGMASYHRQVDVNSGRLDRLESEKFND